VEIDWETPNYEIYGTIFLSIGLAGFLAWCFTGATDVVGGYFGIIGLIGGYIAYFHFVWSCNPYKNNSSGYRPRA
jgi:hypothetical protein